MLEREYQSQLIRHLRFLFPDCLILKNDPDYLQGVPDLLILHQDCWAALEVKSSSKATLRPNQAYYISKMQEMSFAAVICPENEKEVLDALQRSFASKGSTRLSKR